jgi:hypothetical protein
MGFEVVPHMVIDEEEEPFHESDKEFLIYKAMTESYPIDGLVFK